MNYLCAKFYTMKKTYKVAGHKFAIVMPDGAEEWNNLGNYEPFVTTHSDDCIFTVEQVDELADIPNMEKITVCSNALLEPRIEVYQSDDFWRLDVAPTYQGQLCFRFLSDKAFSKAQIQIIDHWIFSFNTMMKLMFSFATTFRDTLQIHSSVTIKDGKGYMFLGKSGTGKSTHSQLWIKNIEGCSLLNDDNPVIRIGEDGVARVYGSPWSGKTPGYRNLEAPIGAIVNLRQAKQNAIRKLSVVESYASLYTSFTGMKFIKELADGYHATNSKLVNSVPIYELECLPDADAAYLCYKTVSQQ